MATEVKEKLTIEARHAVANEELKELRAEIKTTKSKAARAAMEKVAAQLAKRVEMWGRTVARRADIAKNGASLTEKLVASVKAACGKHTALKDYAVVGDVESGFVIAAHGPVEASFNIRNDRVRIQVRDHDTATVVEMLNVLAQAVALAAKGKKA